jgi:alanyl-tRNA synthetase
LGDHVAQKGSLVNENGMRFDFSHFAKLTEEEISSVTALVNEKIRENIDVVIREMPKDEAMQLGAMALFGEKYGNTVRVVTIDPAFSNELCGGTHVGRTGELGFCCILSESGVAAGVRRIEAVCSKAFEGEWDKEQHILKEIGTVLKNPRDLVKAAIQLADELSASKKHVEQLEHRLMVFQKSALLSKFTPWGNMLFLGELVEASSAESLRKLCNELRNSAENACVVLGAEIGGKPSIALGIADTLAAEQGLDAVALIKTHVAALIKGGGGGQKTLATAGGQDPAGLTKAIEQLKQAVSTPDK